jgi:hypothetical protein
MVKKNSIIFFILFIGILAIGVSFLSRKHKIHYSNIATTPTPLVIVNKESGLTTYQSSKGKFFMQYPNDFELHVDEVRVQHSDTFHPVTNVIELDSPYVARNPYILVQYGENMTNQTVEEYIENSSECEEVEEQKGRSLEVSGISGRAFFDILCNSGGETRVYVIKGMMEYTIVFAEKPVDREFVKKFLSGFSIM